MYIKTERAAGELECQSGHLSQTVRSSKAAANKRSQRRYGASVTATAKAQQVMPSMRGPLGSLASSGFLQLGLGEKGASIAMRSKEEHSQSALCRRNPWWLERGEGKGPSDEGRLRL